MTILAGKHGLCLKSKNYSNVMLNYHRFKILIVIK